MTDLIKILNNPEEHYPGNFDTPQRANALLTGLCQDAANEIAKLQAEVERLKASIAFDKMAENARELGLDYEPAVQEKCFLCGERVDSCASDVCPKSAQPAVQEGRDWSLLEATQESLREHMAEIKRLKAAQPAPVQEKNQSPYPEYDRGFSNGWDRGFAAAQPAPVQHDECVVCGDKVRVIPRPWVGLSEEEILKVYDAVESAKDLPWFLRFACAIEAKLKGKNHG
jgi:uncharacterized small protein (DUF1192 family)